MSNLLGTTNSSLSNASTLLGTTNSSLLNVSTSLDTAIINIRDTAVTAGFALGEVNALALSLGLSMAMNTAGEFIKTGAFSSDTGEFTQSVSSTDIYCTNLHVYNSGQVNGDLGCNGNIHCLSTVFCDSIGTDYCLVTASLRTLNFETFRGVYLIGNASIGVDSSKMYT